LRLANTVGIIDSDYYFSDNEGHIMAKIAVEGDQPVLLKVGERFMQGIFIPYGITYTDKATEVRNGGFGSTGTVNGKL
jgi:dUTP pyrophosphatase